MFAEYFHSPIRAIEHSSDFEIAHSARQSLADKLEL